MNVQTSKSIQAFSEEVATLRNSWALWQRLFHRDEDPELSPDETIAEGDRAYRVTGEVSTRLFQYMRWFGLKSILIDTCRLCDPKEFQGTARLSLPKLLEESASQFAPEWLRVLEHTVETTIGIVKAKIRPLRNTVLVHCDYETAVGDAPYPSFDLSDVNHAIRMIEEFEHQLTNPGSRYRSVEQSREEEAPMLAAADRLIDVLERGLDDRPQSDRAARA